ncbi:MAG: DNA repair protein RecN [Firmicutes bacterium]|nr:DNA repair protein RecN [Bacillota bacterium]MCL2770926.1 DNA repair protein RecN [Bacillota bacterium]
MLKELEIKNFALISQQRLVFSSGLSVLSGETGAGKSIIIGSLKFVAGAKADTNSIKSGSDKCEVRAFFVIKKSAELLEELEAAGIEIEDGNDIELILFRSVDISGKVENRINGKSVTAGMIKTIGSLLVDIHGQHEQQKLIDVKKQLEILDAFCGKEVEDIKSAMAVQISKISEANRQIKSLGGNEEDRARTIDFLKFQITEIEEANLKTGEEEKLAEKKTIMLSSGKVSTAVAEAKRAFDGAEDYSTNGVVKAIEDAISQFSLIKNYGEEYANILERLQTLKIDSSDIASEISGIDVPEFSEKELDKIEERLNIYKTIKRKYGNTLDDVFAFLQNSKDKLEKLENSEELLKKLTEEKSHAHSLYLASATRLSILRKKKAKEFEAQIKMELQTLGMEKAAFECKVEPVLKESAISKNGIDDVEFMFTANVGHPLKPLSKVVSGGEMSRLSLTIKTILKSNSSGQTMIFDEVDAGISGKMGQVLSEKLANISRGEQVIVISHLAQIVSMADHNFIISKYEENQKTVSKITELKTEEEVLLEIKRLAGAVEGSLYGTSLAKELKDRANLFKLKG